MPLHPHLTAPGGGLLDGGRVHPDVSAQIAAQRGRGAPLPDGVREHVGSAFGDSFGDVRVHADELAGALARSVQARAFTTGADIFFDPSAYDPRSAPGRELIAHELAHVVQQRGVPTTGELRVSEPGDTLEREAERAAGAVGGA